jgi:hypothetical protein
MLHSFMSFSAILLWSSAVVLLRYCILFSAMDICRDSFVSLLCLILYLILCRGSLSEFFVVVLVRRCFISFLNLMCPSFTLVSAIVLCCGSFISFSNLCCHCFALLFCIFLLSCSLANSYTTIPSRSPLIECHLIYMRYHVGTEELINI